MHHALVPFGAQEVRVETLSPAIVIDPSGTKGVLLQLNSPSKDVHAGISGLILHGIIMLNAI